LLIAGTEQLPPTKVGWTPIFEAARLASTLKVARLYIKDDSRNPTASFKDRASAVGVAKAKEFGFSEIACASTGNAASSLAGAAAAVGLRSTIFVPENAPEPKLAQLLIFGARVVRVKKPATGITAYEAAYDLCTQLVALRLVQSQLRHQFVSCGRQENLRPRNRRADAAAYAGLGRGVGR
jgi:threonine synthase